ncbi:GGDEF domain-containing protein [Mycolicibacterium cosmeticum]|uniref:Diguanylate cyclase n=1 Tax=Mycolicibacterium cosmeticum TaxID=258533 RepID=W9ARQ0_MYCCO|nr:GGDEF domain-containing protein [Mycolicibacterium cosmeticum]TLH71958.1 GGDEF domain-containing protein [Mycolicibacterium cosmeticum]CDO08163.1 diguanylate cyclase [Mycolicibacterium cosmeticum]
MARWARVPGRQADQYDWISAYLYDRGLQGLWRVTIFIATVLLAASTALMTFSPEGPGSRLTTIICFVAAGSATGAAVPFLLHWPTRRQSMVFSLVSTATIAAAALSFTNPYVGLMGCATFAVIGGFVAYFHTRWEVVLNGGVAAICAAVLAGRVVADTGDIYLAAAAVAIVAALNIGLPFGIESLVRTLRVDLRSSGRDPLTGLHNRRSFHYSAYELIMRHHGTGAHLIITMIDLDNFKQLNDTHGHAAGDAALIGVSAALEKTCRRSAVIGRAGGEEFLIADVVRQPAPEIHAEQLRQAIADTPAPVTASVGTASAPLDGDAAAPNLQLIDDLIRAADDAMYQAKRAGGNRSCHNGHP